MGRMGRVIGVVGLATGMVLAAVVPASAAGTVTVGQWNLNEGPGARVANDSSGSGLDGTVGSDVSTGVRYDGATGYRFPTWRTDGVRPQHLVTIPDSDRLDPGTSDYAVTVRFRTARDYSNVLQKGQGGTPGGNWKVEVYGGVVQCLFVAGNGSRVGVGSARRIDDGRWHTVRCGRSGASVSMYVDGAWQSTRSGISGSLANAYGVALGGKSRCDQVSVICDYFAGDVDYVRIQKG
jgi:hypothetical protein